MVGAGGVRIRNRCCCCCWFPKIRCYPVVQQSGSDEPSLLHEWKMHAAHLPVATGKGNPVQREEPFPKVEEGEQKKSGLLRESGAKADEGAG